MEIILEVIYKISGCYLSLEGDWKISYSMEINIPVNCVTILIEVHGLIFWKTLGMLSGGSRNFEKGF